MGTTWISTTVGSPATHMEFDDEGETFAEWRWSQLISVGPLAHWDRHLIEWVPFIWTDGRWIITIKQANILLFTCMWFLGPKRYQTFLAVNLKSLGCEPVKEIKIRAVRFLKYQLYPFTPLDCISDTTSFLLDQGVVRKLIHALFAAVLNWLAWSATQELCFQRPPVLETRSPSQVVEQISFLLPWSICLSCCCCGCHSLIYCASFFRVPSNNKRARSGARGGAREKSRLCV